MLGILNKHDKIDIEILFTGLILIALAVTKSNRKYNMRILAQIGLICYTIITSIIIFMLITVAYPKLIAFVILLIIGVSNILISIIDSFKTFFGGYWWLAHFSPFYHSQNIDIQRHCKTLYRDTNP